MGYSYEWRIRPGHTDFSGLVYTPELADGVLEAIEALLHDIGQPFAQYASTDFISPTVNLNLDYLAAMEIGDRIQIHVVPEIGTTSITFNVTGRSGGEDTFTGSLTVAFIDQESSESIPVPDEFRDGLRPYTTESN